MSKGKKSKEKRLKWVNQPRKYMLRDIILHDLDKNACTLKEINKEGKLNYGSTPLHELKRQANTLEKKGKITHYTIIREKGPAWPKGEIYYIRTKSTYTFHNS